MTMLANALSTLEVKKIFTIRSANDTVLIWAAISIDVSLPKGAKKRLRNGTPAPIRAIQPDDDPLDPTQLARDIQTVSKQSFQNYKSAVKWFYEYKCVE